MTQELDNTLIKSIRNKLQSVLTDIPVGMSWANTKDGKILFVNNRFTAMFGYELADLSTIQDWIAKCYINPEQATDVKRFWSDIDAIDEEHQYIDEIELDILCKDGEVKTVLSGKILLSSEHWALATFVDITDRIKAESIVRKQAMEDELTGLLNKRAFGEALQKSLNDCSKNNKAMELLVMDLDGFKHINDTYGHAAGDDLLQQVSTRLRLAVRTGDYLCRIGGDEFALVVNTGKNPDTVTAVADRVISSMAESFLLDNIEVNIGISVGIASYIDSDTDETSLFNSADQALYRAKAAGKGQWSR